MEKKQKEGKWIARVVVKDIEALSKNERKDLIMWAENFVKSVKKPPKVGYAKKAQWTLYY